MYATTVIADTIRVFSNQKHVESIYAGIPEYKVADYMTYLKNSEIKKEGNSLRRVLVLNQPPSYLYTLIDPNGRFLYRVISHGTKSGISQYNGEEIAVTAGATLLVIDLKTRKPFTQELPLNEIQIEFSASSKPFVSSKGIHFMVKGQENEDEVQFRVFGIE